MGCAMLVGRCIRGLTESTVLTMAQASKKLVKQARIGIIGGFFGG